MPVLGKLALLEGVGLGLGGVWQVGGGGLGRLREGARLEHYRKKISVTT